MEEAEMEQEEDFLRSGFVHLTRRCCSGPVKVPVSGSGGGGVLF